MLGELILNTVRWVIPGLLLFDGCRTRRRWVMAVASLLAFHFFVAGLVARRIPPKAALQAGAGWSMQRSRLKHCSRLGYSAPDMSTMLAGASWAMIGCIPLCAHRWQRLALGAAAAFTLYGQALTGGRAGWAAWAVVGLILCVVRWRKYLFLAPVAAIVLYFVFPASAERAQWGLHETTPTGEEVVDKDKAMSGRWSYWPYVIEMIEESPLVGYGRLAPQRTDLRDRLIAGGELAGGPVLHPHNMYLEWLFDNGVVGLAPVLLFYGILVAYAWRLFRTSGDAYSSTAGALGLCFVLPQLIAGLTAQHFYPRESTLGMWAAIFLMLRVHVERSRVGSRVGNLATVRTLPHTGLTISAPWA